MAILFGDLDILKLVEKMLNKMIQSGMISMEEAKKMVDECKG